MAPRLKLQGQKIGRLLVLEDVGNNKRGGSLWKCRCDCGKEYIGLGTLLTTGHTQSCGCLHVDTVRITSATHGYTRGPKKSRTYKCWQDMKKRCSSPQDSHYHLYGGRGIAVCDRWLDSFENFLSDMGECPGKLSLDRIDNNGNYCPENCRWATNETQGNNKRTNRLLEFMGMILTMKQWAIRIGINYDALRARLDRGWPVELALTTPTRRF